MDCRARVTSRCCSGFGRKPVVRPAEAGLPHCGASRTMFGVGALAPTPDPVLKAFPHWAFWAKKWGFSDLGSRWSTTSSPGGSQSIPGTTLKLVSCVEQKIAVKKLEVHKYYGKHAFARISPEGSGAHLRAGGAPRRPRIHSPRLLTITTYIGIAFSSSTKPRCSLNIDFSRF